MKLFITGGEGQLGTERSAAAARAAFHHAHGLARHVLETMQSRGRIAAFRLRAITTADYPTPARRPPCSVLDCRRIEAVFGVRRLPWTQNVENTVDRLLAAAGARHAAEPTR